MKASVIIYDSECSLCKRFKQALEYIDKSQIFSFISLHDENVYGMFSFLDKEKCQKDIHIVSEHQEVYVGADAIAYIISKVPSVNRFVWLIEKDSSKRCLSLFNKGLKKIRKATLNRCSRCH